MGPFSRRDSDREQRVGQLHHIKINFGEPGKQEHTQAVQQYPRI